MFGEKIRPPQPARPEKEPVPRSSVELRATPSGNTKEILFRDAVEVPRLERRAILVVRIDFEDRAGLVQNIA
jgi:hypothetical protein